MKDKKNNYGKNQIRKLPRSHGLLFYDYTKVTVSKKVAQWWHNKTYFINKNPPTPSFYKLDISPQFS